MVSSASYLVIRNVTDDMENDEQTWLAEEGTVKRVLEERGRGLK
jgi:hypothetical protein